MRFVTLWWAAAALVPVLSGCAPPMDWREVRAGAVVVTLPCRPSVYERKVPLAGAPTALQLQACSAGGATWALADADLADPALVTSALQQLNQAMADNTAGRVLRDEAWQPTGATPNPQSRRIGVEGRRPDGRPVRQHSVAFAVGTRVVQVSVVGDAPAEDDVDALLASVRVTP